MLLADTPTAAKEAEEIMQALPATYEITSLGTARQFPKLYQAIVGSRMYIALAITLDISCAVAALSRSD